MGNVAPEVARRSEVVPSGAQGADESVCVL